MTRSAPQFLYFDLGNVLLFFDHQIACRQMAEVAGVSEQLVWKVVFESDLQWQFERGEVSDREFYDAFCQQTDSQPDFDALHLAGSDIFTLNVGIVPVVASLKRSGARMGILSNTCKAHWDYICSRFTIVNTAFDHYALSYEIGSMKPSPEIYRAAAEMAGVEAASIFFVDDREEHVAAALQAGFDAIPFSSNRELVVALRDRGLRFNY